MKYIKKFESMHGSGVSGMVEEPKTWLAIIYGEKGLGKKAWTHDGCFKKFDSEEEVDAILKDIANTDEYKGRKVRTAEKWTEKRVKGIEKIQKQGQ